MKTMNKVMLYVSILPIVKSAIETVEQLASGTDWTGKQKKDAAIGVVFDLVGAIGTAGKVKEINALPREVVQPVVEMVIDMFVSLYNVFGAFGKKSK